MWTTLPSETGWYWFAVDTSIYKGLPEEITAPKMIFLRSEPQGMRADDPAEPLCSFDATKMVGLWCKVAPPPPVLFAEKVA